MINELATITNNLPLDASTIDEATLDAIMGIGGDDKMGSSLPKLSIEYDSEFIDEEKKAVADEAGKKYKPETLPYRSFYRVNFQTDWADEDPEGPYVTVYAEEAKFLVLVKANRFQIYSVEEEKMVMSTEIFRKWEVKIVDDLGGEQLAKHYKKKMLSRYAHLIEKDRDLKCKNVLYGLLTLEGAVDRHGNKVEGVVNMPCEWYTHGASFMPITKAFDNIKSQGLKMYHRWMHLTTGREKNGNVTYFPVEVTWGNDHVDLSDEFKQLGIDFGVTIDTENDQIRSKYEAKHAKNKADALADVVTDQSLDMDDDEIPF